MLKASCGATNHWQISFVPSRPSPTSYDAYAALLGSGLSSDVTAGENRGRHLTHDFVVLKLVKTKLSARNGEWQGGIELSPQESLPKDRLAIAVWITAAGRVEPLQATGGWLPRSQDVGESKGSKTKPEKLL